MHSAPSIDQSEIDSWHTRARPKASRSSDGRHEMPGVREWDHVKREIMAMPVRATPGSTHQATRAPRSSCGRMTSVHATPRACMTCIVHSISWDRAMACSSAFPRALSFLGMRRPRFPLVRPPLRHVRRCPVHVPSLLHAFRACMPVCVGWPWST